MARLLDVTANLNQHGQTRCTYPFLASTRYRSAEGDDVEALNACDAIDSVLLLKRVHLVTPVRLH